MSGVATRAVDRAPLGRFVLRAGGSRSGEATLCVAGQLVSRAYKFDAPATAAERAVPGQGRAA